MTEILLFSYSNQVPPFQGGYVGESLRYKANASKEHSGWMPSYTDTESSPPTIASFGPQSTSLSLFEVLRSTELKSFLSFFDSLVTELPANPTIYNGSYSFSSVPGSYHMIGGILENPEGGQRYLFFCVKRAGSSFVSIVPPYPIKEVVQMTSRYAKMWVGNPGPPLSQGQMPTQYCQLANLMEEGTGSNIAEFRNLTVEVFHDWVAFSGEVGGTEEARIVIEIKIIPEMTIVKTLEGYTQNFRFYLSTHLPPGEYTYEAYAYTFGSGSTSEDGDSYGSGDPEWGGIGIM